MSRSSPAVNDERGYLAGLSVLVLGDGVAGASAASMLALFGASVTTVVDRAAPYRHGRPHPKGQHGSGESYLALILDSQKRIIDWPGDIEPTVTGLGELTARWRDESGPSRDRLVISDRVGRPLMGLAELSTADEHARWVRRVNEAAWVTISAFGLSGPRRDDFATELTLAAATGMLSLVRDAQTGSPMKLAGYQLLHSAGQAATLASCHAIDLATHGPAAHLDVSAQEAAVAIGPMLTLAQALLGAVGASGAARYGAPAGFYPCRDGLIRISAMEDHQWRGVVRAMGSPAWTTPFTTTEARIASPAKIDAGITEWVRERSKIEAETLLQAEGVPATAMNSPSEILASPQYASRNAVTSLPTPEGQQARVIGRPFTAIPAPGEDPGAIRRRSLRGLRVLEAGHVLAVPLAGALLGALGAQVTKLEDVRRIDMYRRRGPFIDGEPGINRAAYFAMVNHSKRSHAADLDADMDELQELLDNTDVVMENFGRHRASTLGLSAYVVMSTGRPVLALSSSGFGYEGPYSAYRVYAYNLHTACGLGYLTRNAAGVPAQMDMAWADLVCGYALATIVAAWAVGPRGNAPAGVDFAMAELVAARFNEFVAAASIDPTSDGEVDRANELSPFAPNGVYQTGDGWIAVSVGDDRAFQALRGQVGNPETLGDERFETLTGRWAGRGDLDGAIERAISSLDAEELAAALRRCGVYAEKVIPAQELPSDPHLSARQFFAPVDHPEWGRRRLIGVPWRPEGGPPIALRPPPRLETVDPASVPGL